MALSDHLTPKQPLGPINQSNVDDPQDAAALLEGVSPFLAALEERATIILGRRGAGKSSVLQGYRSQARFGRTYGRIPDTLLKSRDLVIPFVRWEQFHKMAQSVGRELSACLQKNQDPDFLFTEATSEIWQAFIWDSIFTEIYSDRRTGRFNPEEEDLLDPVFEYFNLASIDSTDISTKISQKLYSNAKAGLESYLEHKEKSCYVLFDNIDEYPIRNPLIENVVSGFLRAVHYINANFSKVNIIVCIPEEVESYIQEHSSNVEKDFTATHRMRWRPIDLLRIVAYRYRCFIEIHDREFFGTIRDLQLSNRADVLSVFDKILPREISNSLGYREPTLAYIVRHTQLIPRHFIIIFNEILKRSHEISGGYRVVDEASVISGVSEGENQVAKQILRPYRDIYPQLIKSAELLLASLPPICEESHLDGIGHRFKNRIERDVPDIWRTLYEVGILGMIEAEDFRSAPDESGIYINAHFHFNSSLRFGKTSRRNYCVHPIFSKFFGLTRADDANKMAIFPKGVPLI